MLRNKIISDLKLINKSGNLLFFKLLLYKSVRIICYIRLITDGNNVILKAFARRILFRSYHIEIGNNVKIGKSLLLPHPFNIVVGANTVIGDNVTIGQNVTLGGNFKKERKINNQLRKTPFIENDVWISTGSVLAGPILIRRNSIIGANSVITSDTIENSITYGYNQLSNKRIKLVQENGKYELI